MDHVYTYTSPTLQKSQYDPTHTLILRNKFSDRFSAKMRKLRGVLRETLIERDCFGLIFLANQQADFSPSGRGEFAYPNDNEKIAYFLAWLKQQLNAEIIDRLGFVRITRDSWTNLYLRQAYERGVRQARQELKKLKIEVPDVDEIDALLNTEPHKSNLESLHQRMINELEGFIADISHRIGRVLSDSFSKGHSPYMILDRINKGLIQGEDRQELGLTLLFGKFVAFEQRTDMIARSEIVRNVAEAALEEYGIWGIEEVGMEVELSWTTAGDLRVCSYCRMKSQQGPYKISEAKGLLPAHVRCRCMWLPVRKKIRKE